MLLIKFFFCITCCKIFKKPTNKIYSRKDRWSKRRPTLVFALFKINVLGPCIVMLFTQLSYSFFDILNNITSRFLFDILTCVCLLIRFNCLQVCLNTIDPSPHCDYFCSQEKYLQIPWDPNFICLFNLSFVHHCSFKHVHPLTSSHAWTSHRSNFCMVSPHGIMPTLTL